MNLRGHLALITGAGQGIGRACAQVLASRGADLVVVDKNRDTLSSVEQDLVKTGRRVFAISSPVCSVGR